jgi:hypothetical protein
MARVLWNDATGRAHALDLGDAPHQSGMHRCSALCVRALAAERPGCTLESDSLQLTVHMRVVDVLPAAADGCDVVVLRRSDVPEHAAALAPDELYVVLLRDCNDPYMPPHAAWGCGPDLLVNCLMPSDTRVPDLFPLSLGRERALHALAQLQIDTRSHASSTAEEIKAVFGNSWLDCERLNARAMPQRKCLH